MLNEKILHSNSIIDFKSLYETEIYFQLNKNLKDYDIEEIIPKVTYDEWCIAAYKGKLIYIDDYMVREVITMKVFKGYEIEPFSDSDIVAMEFALNCDCSGMTDDFQLYGFFKFK